MLHVLASSATANPVTIRVASSSPGALVVYGAAAALLLVGLLVIKELLDAYAREPHVEGTLRQDAVERVSRVATAATVPLGAVFAIAVVVKVMDVL